jgi:membrane protease YdiL (CAAX protease family)
MCLSFLVVRQGNLGFVITAIATILRDLALVSLIAFFLWRNHEAKNRIGWRFRGSRDILLGVLLFAAVFLAAGYLDQLLLAAGLSAPTTQLPKFLTAQGPAEYLLAFLLVAVVAVAEEVIFRGYMILRLTEITRSSVAAILLSSVIFALGHGYEGTVGVVTVGFMGLAFAIVYVWTGSLAAPILMHFLQDFVGIILLPLLKHR